MSQRLSQAMAQMRVINPKVLRVTPAFEAFHQCGVALRNKRDLYHKSRESQKISTFWSHSWHGGSWKKILTLMTFYNGTPAVILGLLVGLVMMPLFSFGLLPGFDRGWTEVPRGLLWSTWSLCSGAQNLSRWRTCWLSLHIVLLCVFTHMLKYFENSYKMFI